MSFLAVVDKLQLVNLPLTLAAENGLLKIGNSHCPQDKILALVSSFLIIGSHQGSHRCSVP